MHLEPGWMALTIEKPKDLHYGNPDGTESTKVGVMAISVSVENGGVQFHNCSTFHWIQPAYEAPAFQYVMYAQAMEKMMKKGIHHAAAMYGSQEECPPPSWTASSQSSVADYILVSEIQEEPNIFRSQKLKY